MCYGTNQTEIAQSASGNPWMFSSKRFDKETGLINFGRRFYDPTLGRFVTTDPLGAADGPNLYAYCGGDPVNLIDPDGQLSKISTRNTVQNPYTGAFSRFSIDQLDNFFDKLDPIGFMTDDPEVRLNNGKIATSLPTTLPSSGRGRIRIGSEGIGGKYEQYLYATDLGFDAWIHNPSHTKPADVVETGLELSIGPGSWSRQTAKLLDEAAKSGLQ